MDENNKTNNDGDGSSNNQTDPDLTKQQTDGSSTEEIIEDDAKKGAIEEQKEKEGKEEEEESNENEKKKTNNKKKSFSEPRNLNAKARDAKARGPWRPEEDSKLIEICERRGAHGWTQIAAELNTGRNGRQCRERWSNQINPAIKRGGWTAEEDAKILELHEQYGNRWAQIAKKLPGRTDNMVKNRFNGSLLPKQTREKLMRAAGAAKKIISAKAIETGRSGSTSSVDSNTTKKRKGNAPGSIFLDENNFDDDYDIDSRESSKSQGKKSRGKGRKQKKEQDESSILNGTLLQTPHGSISGAFDFSPEALQAVGGSAAEQIVRQSMLQLANSASSRRTRTLSACSPFRLQSPGVLDFEDKLSNPSRKRRLVLDADGDDDDDASSVSSSKRTRSKRGKKIRDALYTPSGRRTPENSFEPLRGTPGNGIKKKGTEFSPSFQDLVKHYQDILESQKKQEKAHSQDTDMNLQSNHALQAMIRSVSPAPASSSSSSSSSSLNEKVTATATTNNTNTMTEAGSKAGTEPGKVPSSFSSSSSSSSLFLQKLLTPKGNSSSASETAPEGEMNTKSTIESLDELIESRKGKQQVAPPPPPPSSVVWRVSKLPCRCKKTRCLKLYCSCFAGGEHCSALCRCLNCANKSGNPAWSKALAEDYNDANAAAVDGPPTAGVFAKDVLTACRCKVSKCLQKYCECFRANVRCTFDCRCKNCHNTDEIFEEARKIEQRESKLRDLKRQLLEAQTEADRLTAVANSGKSKEEAEREKHQAEVEAQRTKVMEFTKMIEDIEAEAEKEKKERAEPSLVIDEEAENILAKAAAAAIAAVFEQAASSAPSSSSSGSIEGKNENENNGGDDDSDVKSKGERSSKKKCKKGKKKKKRQSQHEQELDEDEEEEEGEV